MAILSGKNRDRLNYRPNIQYIEPQVQPEEPHPVQEIEDDVLAQRRQDELLALADAVDILGAALQARINERAKDMRITLDPNVDAQAIQAMCRMFGDSDDLDDCNFLSISYDQYRQVREKICQYGAQIAEDAETKPAKTPNLLNADSAFLKDGSLRPELSSKAQVIKPLDMKAFTESLFKLLVRHIWKNFFRKPLAKLPVIGKKVPKQLPGTKIKKGFKAQLIKAKKQGVKVIGL